MHPLVNLEILSTIHKGNTIHEQLSTLSILQDGRQIFSLLTERGFVHIMQFLLRSIEREQRLSDDASGVQYRTNKHEIWSEYQIYLFYSPHPRLTMPNPHRLSILTELRQEAGLTLTQMAQHCGLTGKQSHQTAGAWERGEYRPNERRRRAKFIGYLWTDLGLHHTPDRFVEVWEILVEEWEWVPIGDNEWKRLTNKPHSEVVQSANEQVTDLKQLVERVEVALQEVKPIQDDPIERIASMPLDELPTQVPLPPCSRMPFSRNPLFVGRKNDLLQLARTLKGGDTIAIGQVKTAAATGLGGIGKTQLASEFVHRYGQFFAGGIFWLSFADPKTVPSEIAACGGPGMLDLRPDYGELSLTDQVNLVQGAWREPVPRLLIFDNCEDEELVAQWRPSSGGCRVLITSRREGWDSTLDVQTLALDILARQESIELLQEHVPNEDTTVLGTIAKELGDLPLALHLAGSYLARYRRVIDGAEYIKQLHNLELLKHRSLQGDRVSPTGHIQNVSRVIALSYERLDIENPIDSEAIVLLAFAAFLAPDEPIERDLLFSIATRNSENDNRETFEDTIARLSELGLVRDEQASGLHVHRLITAFARTTIPAAVLSIANECVELELIRMGSRLNELEHPEHMAKLVKHLLSVTALDSLRMDKRYADLLLVLGEHLWMLGQIDQSKDCFERARYIYEDVCGDHADTATCLNNLGIVYYAAGDIRTASSLLQTALAMRKTIFVEDHPDIAESLNNLALMLQNQEKYKESQVYYEEAFKIHLTVFGLEHQRTALSISNIGYILYVQGQLSEAKSYYIQSLDIFERILPPKHVRIAEAQTFLGQVMLELNELEQARDVLNVALEIRANVLGTQHRLAADTLHILSQVMVALDEPDMAHTYCEQVLEIRLKVFGENHLSTADASYDLAKIIQLTGKMEDANRYFNDAAIIYARLLGDEHTKTKLAYNMIKKLD